MIAYVQTFQILSNQHPSAFGFSAEGEISDDAFIKFNLCRRAYESKGMSRNLFDMTVHSKTKGEFFMRGEYGYSYSNENERKRHGVTAGFVSNSEKFGWMNEFSQESRGDPVLQSGGFFVRSSPVPDYDWRATIEPDRES